MKALKWISLSFAALIVLVALFYAEEDWRGWHAWQKYRHEWEAKGERFDFASMVPSPVPDDQNFAMTPVIASCYERYVDKNGKKLDPPNTNIIDQLGITREGDYGLVEEPTNYSYWMAGKKTDLKEWQNYYRTLATKTNLFPISQRTQSPGADVLLALSRYDSNIEEIRQASALPFSRFPIYYNAVDPFNILLFQLSSLKRCTQVLELRASAELENGQSEKALEDVKLMLRLNDAIRSEPFLISHLVRIAMMSFALQPVWEGLAAHKWSDGQLVGLDQELAKKDFLKDYELSMRGERTGAIAEIESLRRERNFNKIAIVLDFMDNFFPSEDSPKPTATKTVFVYLMPSGWFYQNEVAIAQLHQSWLLRMADSNQQLIFPQIKNDADVSYRKMKPRSWNAFAYSLTPALALSVEKFALAQSSINLARTACALERHWLAHGKYPATLDALAPQFIAQLPHDIINGQPLHYWRTDSGRFILYSVGWNGTDDGGQVGLKKDGFVNNLAGDWVWKN